MSPGTAGQRAAGEQHLTSDLLLVQTTDVAKTLTSLPKARVSSFLLKEAVLLNV